MLEQMIESAWEEAMDEASLPDIVHTARPALHAVSVIWQSMPPQQKAYLIDLAKSALKQLRENPRGLLLRIAMLAALLIARNRVPPKQAVKQVAMRVVTRRRRLQAQQGRIRKHRTPPPRPMQSRWQRGRRGQRFENGY